MLSRRNFLKGTLGAGAGLSLGAQSAPAASEQMLAQASGPAPQASRKRMIVDAQVHLWLADTPQRPWAPGGPGRAHLSYPFTVDQLLPLMNEGGIDRVVIVPPSWEGDRNEYALDAAKKYPGRFAVMGRVQLDSPQARAQFPDWKKQPGMLGVRLSFAGLQDKWMSDGTADWYWPAAAKAGIPTMILITGRQAEFARVVERNPDNIFIIDHMALSNEIVKSGKAKDVIDGVVAFARHPNVSCKLSSTPTRSLEGYPFRDMAPHLKRVFDAYGPRRCFWGTDITAAIDKATYRQRVTHFTETLNFLSEEDKDWVMGRAILARLGWA